MSKIWEKAENVNIDLLVRAYQEMDAEVQEKYATSLSQLLATGVLTLVTLFKARRHAKKGNWPAAIYYAVLWSGITRNQHANIADRKQELKDKKLSDFENLFSSGDSAVGLDKPGSGW